jgi:hypothetical protein
MEQILMDDQQDLAVRTRVEDLLEFPQDVGRRLRNVEDHGRGLLDQRLYRRLPRVIVHGLGTPFNR